jgi:hypothetical protein
MAIRQLKSALLHRLRDPVHMGQRYLQSLQRGRELEAVQDNTARIRSSDVLLFATLRNEAVRIPFFLDYYRRLGVHHFLFVDNGSTDGFRDLVADCDDVSVWGTEASYAAANFGMHWLNALLRRYGCEHWCVTCDPDEFLVFPYCDQRNLTELGTFLESEGARSLSCIMLDMYSDRPLEDTVYRAGDDPFEIAPWFDGNGYTQYREVLRDNYTRGGVRRRRFFSDDPECAPALNKTPFVKWRWTYSYFGSMHQLVPSWLNDPERATHRAPTGALAHFKYFSVLRDKVREELVRGEHWNDSFEYRRYDAQLERRSEPFIAACSVRYDGWRQLAERGFLNLGQWF